MISGWLQSKNFSAIFLDFFSCCINTSKKHFYLLLCFCKCEYLYFSSNYLCICVSNGIFVSGCLFNTTTAAAIAFSIVLVFTCAYIWTYAMVQKYKYTHSYIDILPLQLRCVFHAVHASFCGSSRSFFYLYFLLYFHVDLPPTIFLFARFCAASTFSCCFHFFRSKKKQMNNAMLYSYSPWNCRNCTEL